MAEDRSFGAPLFVRLSVLLVKSRPRSKVGRQAGNRRNLPTKQERAGGRLLQWETRDDELILPDSRCMGLPRRSATDCWSRGRATDNELGPAANLSLGVIIFPPLGRGVLGRVSCKFRSHPLCPWPPDDRDVFETFWNAPIYLHSHSEATKGNALNRSGRLIWMCTRCDALKQSGSREKTPKPTRGTNHISRPRNSIHIRPAQSRDVCKRK